MLRVTRVYLYSVEKQLNQLQAYAERLRRKPSSIRTASNAGKSEPAQEMFQTADALELKICEIRAILSEFKRSENLESKKELKNVIEKRLYQLKDAGHIGTRAE